MSVNDHLRALALLTEVGATHSLVVDLVDTHQGRVGAIGSGSGAPAPANLEAVQLDADCWATLTHNAGAVARARARRSGKASLLQAVRNHDVPALVDQLGRMLLDTPDGLVAALVRDLEAWLSAAGELVDGADRMPLEAPCPWCKRRTLTVDLVDSTISCQRDRDSGRFEPCRCGRPDCGCAASAAAVVTSRHTWRRDRPGDRDGWLALASQLNLDRYRKADPA